MLGGGFWVSFLRNGTGAVLMMAVFLMLDRPRFSMKKTVTAYLAGGLGLVLSFSFWYLADWESYVRFAGILAIPVTGVFCAFFSGDGIYLSLYKISFGFYLLSVCVFCGVDLSRWLFGGNLWVDLLIRFLLLFMILRAAGRRFRRFFFENVDFLRREMDFLSVTTLIVSFVMAAFVAYLPSNRVFSVYNMLRMLVSLFMAGMIQYLILHLYIHLGQMHSYQAEKQLLEMNEQFLLRQLELERRAEEDAARIRHDVRHHWLLLKEYAKRGDTEGLLDYMKQYGEDLERAAPKRICANRSVNGILSAYAGYAEKENIQVLMEAAVAEKLAVRDIDLVAVLANIFENAIHGCLVSGKQDPEIRLSIVQKGHKVVIQCRNSSTEDIRFHNGLPQARRGGSTGVSSIVKTAQRYRGETDFAVKDGMFLVRVLLNLPAGDCSGPENRIN